jgi:hypothetical protein
MTLTTLTTLTTPSQLHTGRVVLHETDIGASLRAWPRPRAADHESSKDSASTVIASLPSLPEPSVWQEIVDVLVRLKRRGHEHQPGRLLPT